MLFSEEANYFPGVDSSVWKPSSNEPVQQSKLNTWTGGASIPRNGSSNGPYMNGAIYDDSKPGWSNGRPPNDRQWQQDGMPDGAGMGPQGLENDFMGMNMGGKGQHQMNGNEYGGPPGGGAQWGRREINQATPWDVPPAMSRPPPQAFQAAEQQNRFMPPMTMDNGTSQWKSWEYDNGYGGRGDYQNPPPFNAGMGGPKASKFPGGMYGGNGPAQQGYQDQMMFNGPPMPGLMQQPWDKMGPPNGTYGGPGGRMPAPYGQPQGGPMGMMPPPLNRSMMPPQMPPHHQMQQPSMQQFQVGNFTMPQDDSVWHDPNGELRKWQRDTGTGIWGDPTKQQAQKIRLWMQPPDEDEKPSSSKDGEKEDEPPTESGWGELPPITGPPMAGSTGTAPWMSNAPSNGGMGGAGGMMPNGGGWADAQRDPRAFSMPQGQQYQQGGGGGFMPQGPPPNEWSNQPPMTPTFDQAAGAQPSISAERLQMARMKGFIDMNVVSNAGRLSPTATNFLTHLLQLTQRLEQNEARVEQIRQIGDLARNGDEYERLVNENTKIYNDIQYLREKVNASVEGLMRNQPGAAPGGKGVSLAEELTSMPLNSVPPIVGGDGGSIW